MVEQVLLELKRGRKLYDLWKQGQASQEGHRPVLCTNRQKTQKLRAEIGLFMPGNKKGAFMYVNSKRRSKENIGLILDKGGHLTNKTEKKQRYSMHFLPQSLIIPIGLHGAQSQRTRLWGQ